MKIHILGTGGADGIPSFFGSSELSEHARQFGGKDVRTRSGAVVDDILKIDFGPDTFVQAATQGLRARDWKWIVVTHSHFDHFDPGLLQYSLPPFVAMDEPAPEVYGNQQVIAELTRAFPSAELISTHLLRSFSTVQIGEYQVTPIAAYHKLDEDSANLIIERDGTSFLYATDTGVYQEPTWDFLYGRRFDCVMIECTDGFNPSDYWGHLSCEEALGMIGRMREMGCLDSSSKIVTTHHAESGGATHAQLQAFFEDHSIEVGFDGMTIEL